MDFLGFQTILEFWKLNTTTIGMWPASVVKMEEHGDILTCMPVMYDMPNFADLSYTSNILISAYVVAEIMAIVVCVIA